jgi:GNAT superfamily N-acetyltransferase
MVMPQFGIGYLVDYPEYIPQLAEWLFQEWDVMLGEKTSEVRIRKLQAHLNREQLPVAWIAHANGELLGTASLREHDIEGHEDLSPWLGGVFVGAQFRRRGIGAALCATVEEAARSRGIQTLYLFTLDKQAWYSRLGWTLLRPCVWYERSGEIMSKQLRTT